MSYPLCEKGAKKNVKAGLPRSGKNVLKMKFFPGRGKVREFCERSVFRKDLESQRKVREFENNGYGSLQKISLFCSKGERMYFLMRYRSLNPSPSSLGALLLYCCFTSTVSI